MIDSIHDSKRHTSENLDILSSSISNSFINIYNTLFEADVNLFVCLAVKYLQNYF